MSRSVEKETDFLGSSKAQASKGSISATIPVDAAAELNLEKGDRLLFRIGEDGEVELANASDLF
jgi:hypothetical protein